MAKTVKYRGPENASLVPVTFSITNRGKTYRFAQGTPQEVPDEVASRLSQVQGHKFTISKSKEDN